jgi:hypothetical protein
MKELDPLYLKILSHGLSAIRDALHGGNLEWCKHETEHLHNMPSLIGDENKHRHLQYLSSERTMYLEWVLSVKDKYLLEYVWMSYAPCWDQMCKILEVDNILKNGKLPPV